MRYEYASENIIICKNFLPPHMLQKINIDLLNNRSKFGIPNWAIDNEDRPQYFSTYCGGTDYWLIGDELKDKDNTSIAGLEHWFYHQGLERFIKNSGRLNVFHFLQKPKSHDIHVVAYNNGGYYNWHTDTKFFTFNLILNKNDALSGGDMLFYDDGRTIEIPNQNNLMVLFPSYINHSITPIKSKDDKDVAFLEQRFSIQYWVKL
jgi:hypothetical protein